SYGHGWTGRSGKWISESIDLSDYAGGRVLVRFEYITDDAVNLDGIVFDDIAVPEIDYIDDVEGPAGWLAEGFKRIDNELPQEFVVQVIEIALDGSSTVRELILDEERSGELLVTGFGTRLENAVVVVTPVTRNTYQPATYKLIVSPER
ncbi:MAG: immune inhibitor A, partial [Chloroflexi bacterium]|nr:immune inhibitor A [Chloroflexota bacterium]